MRRLFIILVAAILILQVTFALIYPSSMWLFLFTLPIMAIGFYDYFQTRHAVLRNFPIIGHFRYMLEAIRPEIQQYFVESDTSGRPFDRSQRSLIYQWAKDERDTVPFGTLHDVYEVGYEWFKHSISPLHLQTGDMHVTVGGPDCTQPYSASIFNISAMSFGSLSKNAILALSGGAKINNFAHNTGEGGISPYHLEGGGDLIWQIGTGYFGCRTPDGNFNPDTFAERASHPHVKMIEIKLSQGAKPGHGGILPATKVTPEIAAIRDVPMGKDVLSPPYHLAFSTPIGLLKFVDQLRQLSGGKPVGFKLCVGKRREFLAICKAMIETSIMPDFIAVDGGEGGTGAAPLEFTNHMGGPLTESLIFVHNSLVGYGLRDQIRIIASGKVTSGYSMVKRLALGADICYSARGMMMAIGCIQAMKCNTNHCPVGIATQNSDLVAGLVPSDKRVRVANFHREMLTSVCEMIGAMGIEHPQELRPWHIMRRTSPTEVKHYGKIYEFLKAGSLLSEPYPKSFERANRAAAAHTFASIETFTP